MLACFKTFFFQIFQDVGQIRITESGHIFFYPKFPNVSAKELLPVKCQLPRTNVFTLTEPLTKTTAVPTLSFQVFLMHREQVRAALH